MKRSIIVISLLSFLVLFGAVGASAQQQTHRPLRASLALGLGGAGEEDADTGFGNSSFQLGFSWDTDEIANVGLRYAQLDLGASFPGVTGAELSYLTVSGGYSFNEGLWESGIYFGLGAYRFEGQTALGSNAEDGLGVTLGVTSEFPITERLGFLIELSGHYADLSISKIFVLGHGGLAFRF